MSRVAQDLVQIQQQLKHLSESQAAAEQSLSQLNKPPVDEPEPTAFDRLPEGRKKELLGVLKTSLSMASEYVDERLRSYKQVVRKSLADNQSAMTDAVAKVLQEIRSELAELRQRLDAQERRWANLTDILKALPPPQVLIESPKQQVVKKVNYSDTGRIESITESYE